MELSLAVKEIMANVSTLIFAAAIAAASVATPVLAAAHKVKPICAHQNRYVTRSGQRSDGYNFDSPPSVYDPRARPSVSVPGMDSGWSIILGC
jgi:hypothetical protein